MTTPTKRVALNLLSNNARWAGLAAAFWVTFSGAQQVQATPTPLGIQVIYASNDGTSIDPKIAKLVKTFTTLRFSAYQLKDEATFNLAVGSTARMQMPNGEWMTIGVVNLTKDNKLRLQLHSEKLKFKSTVVVDPGATIAVGGPAHEKGTLILALTRAAKKTSP